jgi:hypothetical protein
VPGGVYGDDRELEPSTEKGSSGSSFLLVLSSFSDSSAMGGDARTACDQSVNQGPAILVFDPRACCILGNYMHDAMSVTGTGSIPEE